MTFTTTTKEFVETFPEAPVFFPEYETETETETTTNPDFGYIESALASDTVEDILYWMGFVDGVDIVVEDDYDADYEVAYSILKDEVMMKGIREVTRKIDRIREC